MQKKPSRHLYQKYRGDNRQTITTVCPLCFLNFKYINPNTAAFPDQIITTSKTHCDIPILCVWRIFFREGRRTKERGSGLSSLQVHNVFLEGSGQHEGAGQGRALLGDSCRVRLWTRGVVPLSIGVCVERPGYDPATDPTRAWSQKLPCSLILKQWLTKSIRL